MGLPLAGHRGGGGLGEAAATLRAWWLAAPALERAPRKEVFA
jgi:hypothetical protein